MTAGQRALFNNVRDGNGAGAAPAERGRETAPDFGADARQRVDLAQAIHETVLRVRPAGWRGNQAKENVIKQALLPLLGDDEGEVERVFAIIEQHGEY